MNKNMLEDQILNGVNPGPRTLFDSNVIEQRIARETEDLLHGPGLFKVDHPDGSSFITNIRRIAGQGRKPGSTLIAVAGWLLFILGLGLLYVSFKAQYSYIFTAKHQNAASMIEAGMLDVGMIIFSLLALGLARAGKSARVERTLIMVCAGASALMNYAASDTASPRSVAAYVAAPIFLAVVVDRVVAVVRRHVLKDEETSAWSAMGGAVVSLTRFSALVLLYSLRTVLAPSETSKGLRRMVLDAAPVPGSLRSESQASLAPQVTEVKAEVIPSIEEEHQDDEVPDLPEFATKKAAFLSLYRGHKNYGDRALASPVAAELAPLAKLQSGTGRTYIAEELTRLASITKEIEAS